MDQKRQLKHNRIKVFVQVYMGIVVIFVFQDQLSSVIFINHCLRQ